MTAKIIHADCDCFFAAVEMRDRPELAQVPMAIGGDPGRRGVIATCNYRAREFGIRSAMASATAKRLCPQLLILPGQMDKYRQASAQVQQIFSRYTDLIEPLSLDEAYLDVSHSSCCGGSATRIAEQIRQQVREEVGITISAGVAPNKLVAKVASDWNKPDGLWVVPPGQVEAFVAQLPVQLLPGVGPATLAKLKKRGVERCQDLLGYSETELSSWLGRFGEKLYQRCRGIDERPVATERQRKSVSVEHTFVTDIADLPGCRQQLSPLLEKLNQRLQRLDRPVAIAGSWVKIKFDDFIQTTVQAPSQGVGDWQLFDSLLERGYQRHQRPVRLLGVGVSLAPEHSGSGLKQLSLFG